jgi:hypothetical protein
VLSAKPKRKPDEVHCKLKHFSSSRKDGATNIARMPTANKKKSDAKIATLMPHRELLHITHRPTSLAFGALNKAPNKCSFSD